MGYFLGDIVNKADQVKKTKEGVVSLKKHRKFSPELLPVIQNLLGLGLSEADIGIVVGYSGKSPKNFLKNLKQNNQDVREACEVGKKLANVYLVATAFKAATGAGFEERETVYSDSDILGNKLEEPIPIRTKVKTRYVPDTAILAKLLETRMPQYFSGTKKTQSESINVDVEGKISELFEMLPGRKRVESKEIK